MKYFTSMLKEMVLYQVPSQVVVPVVQWHRHSWRGRDCVSVGAVAQDLDGA